MRAVGADGVVAADLGADILGRHLRADPPGEAAAGAVGAWIRKLKDNLGPRIAAHPPDAPPMPSLFEVLVFSINIMQVRIARSRRAGEPPDLVVALRLAHLRLLDVHRAKEAMEEGRRAVERVAHTLALLTEQAG